MKTLIWIITWTVLAIWSLFSWLAYGLIGVSGSLIAGNADIIPADPLLIEWASWLATVGTDVGEWLVIALWALVSLVILAAGYVAARIVPGRRQALQNR
jgi:hypothetical protein